jgi:uncharacterized protein YndB with AHSA1/START domain
MVEDAMAKTQTLTFKETINAPAADTYRAFTSSTAMRYWFSDVALADPQKGGRFYAGWNDGYYAAGEYLSLTPDKKVVFSWLGRGEPAASRVQVTLAEKKAGLTVTVTHSGLGSGKAWAKAVKGITAGWQSAMRNLKSTLETGEDLRISKRPMLGIMPGAYDDEIAKRLKVPTAFGVRLDGTLEGMGAHAIGLQADDVIVSLGGKKVTGATLGVGLVGKQAGDKVAVKYYRGPKLINTSLVLSGRALPEIPQTAAELATRVGNLYAELNTELEKCFEGATEAQASYKATPDEWSAKDVLCHLLSGERDGHSPIAETIWGIQRYYDSFGDNLNERHAAMLSVLPTYRLLLDEYKRAQDETVALLAAMPDKAVARKSDWWQLCFGFLQPPLHNYAHFEQIKAAIAAAQQAKQA